MLFVPFLTARSGRSLAWSADRRLGIPCFPDSRYKQHPHKGFPRSVSRPEFLESGLQPLWRKTLFSDNARILFKGFRCLLFGFERFIFCSVLSVHLRFAFAPVVIYARSDTFPYYIIFVFAIVLCLISPCPTSPSSGRKSILSFGKMPSACRISLFFRHLIAYRQLSANLSTITDRQIVGHGIEEVCGQR